MTQDTEVRICLNPRCGLPLPPPSKKGRQRCYCNSRCKMRHYWHRDHKVTPKGNLPEEVVLRLRRKVASETMIEVFQGILEGIYAR